MADQNRNAGREWPWTPPLEPGKGEELRHIAGPGDDTVFEANSHRGSSTEAKRSKANPKSANDDTERMDDDAQHSRTER